jgi:hypothetical protein
MRARFLTRPQASPSGVSAGQSIPHCDACRARGPLTCTQYTDERVTKKKSLRENLACLLKLRVDTLHHAKCRDERKARQNLHCDRSLKTVEEKKHQQYTEVTPARDILKRLTAQLPVEIARLRPLVIVSLRMNLAMSKALVFCLGISISACFFNYKTKTL